MLLAAVFDGKADVALDVNYTREWRSLGVELAHINMQLNAVYLIADKCDKCKIHTLNNGLGNPHKSSLCDYS